MIINYEKNEAEVYIIKLEKIDEQKIRIAATL